MTDTERSQSPRGGLGRDRMPAHYTFTRQTPTFDRASLPEALKRAHTTKAGVWGLIVVEQGEVSYTIDASGDVEEATHTLTPTEPGVVAPEEHHHVRLDDDNSRFHVAFYATDKTEPQS